MNSTTSPNTSKSIQSLEKARSQAAFKNIQTWTQNEQKLDDHVKYLSGLPIEMRTQGLILTCVSLLKKDKFVTKQIVNAIVVWLSDSRLPCQIKGLKDGKDLLTHLLDSKQNHAHYLALQREAIAFTEKLKLLAEAWENGCN